MYSYFVVCYVRICCGCGENVALKSRAKFSFCPSRNLCCYLAAVSMQSHHFEDGSCATSIVCTVSINVGKLGMSTATIRGEKKEINTNETHLLT